VASSGVTGGEGGAVRVVAVVVVVGLATGAPTDASELGFAT
jgi:hypothetical protein